MSNTRHTNRLSQETSPYLLQHAHNPVDWYPWGPEALERAKKEDRPILLSVGYSACHWCHVMERESFENEEIAALMNQHYVCIKVDREERPDIDEIYMAATVQMSGRGGWPMTCFLTPDQKPFFAGTYFPPADSPAGPGFANLVGQLGLMFKERRGELEGQAERLTQRVARVMSSERVAGGLEIDLLEQAAEELGERYDHHFGGFSGAPKFPATTNLGLLLRYYKRSGEERNLQMVRHTLDCMASGGFYDQIGGGFTRYSTDERWLVPHFEKMLCDNALLTKLYLDGYQTTHDPYYARIARETLDYVLREMTGSEGGFHSSSDADSEGEEGKFFVWTPAEIEAILGEERGKKFCSFYDISKGGNWEGKSVPNTPHPRNFNDEMAAMRDEVFQARLKRVAPGVDDKILTSWNGMMISAFAEGYRVLGDERYLEAAGKAASFLRSKLTSPEGKLLRTYRNGKAHLAAYLEDHAWLAEGLIDLYEAGGDEDHLKRAEELARRILDAFADEERGGFFDTASDHEKLIVRHRGGSDGANPSANSIAASVLMRLSYHFDRPEWREKAVGAVSAYAGEVRRMPSAFAQGLAVLAWAEEGPWEIVYGERPSDEIKTELARHFLPEHVIAWTHPGSKHPVVQGKTSGVHICRSQTCAAPATNPAELKAAFQQLHNAPPANPRLAGRATPNGTLKLSQEHPGRYRELGKTGLMVSVLGFGGYRVDDIHDDHDEALRAALDLGLNLIDTSTNYTDGDSERLVGSVMPDYERETRVVVSKLGYVQGQNLELVQRRRKHGRPFPEVVEYDANCWHCIHPDYLADQLERCLHRLHLETLDICLLHNPEYYLSDAVHRPTRAIEELRGAFYARMEAAFRYLEGQVKAGRIGYYGVSSNTVVDNPEKIEATDLEEMLKAAKRAGGDDHHFRVLQLPLNLVESEAVLSSKVLEVARANDIAVLVNRPLNAFKDKRMARLADFEHEEEEPEFEESLAALKELEDEYRATFGPYVQGPGSEDLFRWADSLATLPDNLQNMEHWLQIEATRIRPPFQDMVNALNQAMNGPLVEKWIEWRDRYARQFRDVMNDLEEVALRKSQATSDAIAEKLDPALPEHQDESLSRKSLWVVASTPGVTCVLNGMRTPDYVEDSCGMLDWKPMASPVDAYKVFQDW